MSMYNERICEQSFEDGYALGKDELAHKIIGMIDDSEENETFEALVDRIHTYLQSKER